MDVGTRNARVVVCLILAMTAGARLLLWLEPSATRPATGTLLTAAGGAPVDQVFIEYLPPDEGLAGHADLLVPPDGHCSWAPRGPRVRVVVVGSDATELGMAQKRALLAALGSMTIARGGELVKVRLLPASDAAQVPTLPPQAHDLRHLLVSKGIIE